MPYNFVCAVCDHPFITPNKYRKYCSVDCNYLGRRKKQERTCEWCKATYHATGKRNERFCSREYWEQDHAHKPKESICETCGKTFTQPRTHNRKNCGKECADIATQKAQDGKVTRICETCGKEYLTKLSKKLRFCSITCSANSRIMHDSSHGYYGPNWKQQRKLARKRDGNRCQYCKITKEKLGKNMDVHHIKPFREFKGDYEQANQTENLICFCPSCHKKAEFGKIPIQPVLF